MSSYKKYLPWNWPGISWSDNPYIWSQVFILIEQFAGAVAGGGAFKAPKRGPVWRSIEKTLKKKGYSDEEATRFLEVVVEVNGLKKKEIREVDDMKKEITVDHIKNTLSIVMPTVKVISVDVKKRNKS